MHLLASSVPFWPGPAATSSGSVASTARNLLPQGPTRVLPGGSGPSLCCYCAAGLISHVPWDFGFSHHLWTWLKHSPWDGLSPAASKGGQRSNAEVVPGEPPSLGETQCNNFPLPPPSQGLLQGTISLNTLLSMLHVAEKAHLPVSSELFRKQRWGILCLAPRPSLPPFTFSLAIIVLRLPFPNEAPASGCFLGNSGFLVLFLLIYFINNEISTCKPTIQNQS